MFTKAWPEDQMQKLKQVTDATCYMAQKSDAKVEDIDQNICMDM